MITLGVRPSRLGRGRRLQISGYNDGAMTAPGCTCTRRPFWCLAIRLGSSRLSSADSPRSYQRYLPMVPPCRRIAIPREAEPSCAFGIRQILPSFAGFQMTACFDCLAWPQSTFSRRLGGGKAGSGWACRHRTRQRSPRRGVRSGRRAGHEYHRGGSSRSIHVSQYPSGFAYGHTRDTADTRLVAGAVGYYGRDAATGSFAVGGARRRGRWQHPGSLVDRCGACSRYRRDRQHPSCPPEESGGGARPSSDHLC